MGLVVDLKNQVLDLVKSDVWRALGSEQIYQWINEAEKALAIHKPEAAAKDIDFVCVQGAQQDLLTHTDDEIVRVLSPKFAGPSISDAKVIYLTKRDCLSAISPAWEFGDASSYPTDFIYDEDDPRKFATFPPASGGTIVRMSAAITPPDYGAVDGSTKTTVLGVYDPALVAWAAYRVFSSDETLPNYLSSAADHARAFYNLTGLKIQNEVRTSVFKSD